MSIMSLVAAILTTSIYIIHNDDNPRAIMLPEEIGDAVQVVDSASNSQVIIVGTMGALTLDARLQSRTTIVYQQPDSVRKSTVWQAADIDGDGTIEFLHGGCEKFFHGNEIVVHNNDGSVRWRQSSPFTKQEQAEVNWSIAVGTVNNRKIIWSGDFETGHVFATDYVGALHRKMDWQHSNLGAPLTIKRNDSGDDAIVFAAQNKICCRNAEGNSICEISLAKYGNYINTLRRAPMIDKNGNVGMYISIHNNSDGATHAFFAILNIKGATIDNICAYDDEPVFWPALCLKREQEDRVVWGEPAVANIPLSRQIPTTSDGFFVALFDGSGKSLQSSLPRNSKSDRAWRFSSASAASHRCPDGKSDVVIVAYERHAWVIDPFGASSEMRDGGVPTKK